MEDESPARPQNLLRPGEAAHILGVHVKTVANWCKWGDLTAHYTIGGHHRYVEQEVRDLAACRKREREAEESPPPPPPPPLSA